MLLSALDAREREVARGVRDCAVGERVGAWFEVVVAEVAAPDDGDGGRGVEERLEAAAGGQAGSHIEKREAVLRCN